jgi:hypothetical protein
LPDRRHGIEHRLQHGAVAGIRRHRRQGEGMPSTSTRRWRLLPVAPVRRVRAGPLDPFGRHGRAVERAPAPVDRVRRPWPVEQHPVGAAWPTPRPVGSRASATSRSCRSRGPACAAASPEGRRTRARTGCRRARPDRPPIDGRLSFGRGQGGDSGGSISAHGASGTKGLAVPA